MSKLVNAVIDATVDVFQNVTYFIESNLVNAANVLNFALPFLMFYLGQDVVLKEKVFTFISPVLLITVLVFICIYYLKAIANKIGKGITIPVPAKRFTEIDDDGEVSVEQSRISEMLLYMADLEDWFDKKGLFR